MKPLDKRQKRLLAGLAGILAAIALLLLIPTAAPEEDPSPESVVAVIPEADLQEEDGSKTGSYRRGGISDYWDTLAEADSPSSDGPPVAESPRRRDARRPSPATVDDLFGSLRDAPGAGPRPQAAGSASSPKEEAPAVTGQKQEAGSPPPAEASRVQVKRSGAVSSLDEDVAADLGNGFSTLDGTDRWVDGGEGRPYRCMFTRDEKVRDGQRITVRLLEDLVVCGVHIPRNTHLQGVVTVGERMGVAVTSLDVGGRILSFRFEAYDTDGGKGIYCPDLGKVRREVTGQGLSTAGSLLNSRLGRIARDAVGVGASLIRNRSGEATVTVSAGYTFYIIEETRQ